MTIAQLSLAARRSTITLGYTYVGLIHNRLDLIHTRLDTI
jgi:hypothetical protein